jgi:hypothetical protein
MRFAPYDDGGVIRVGVLGDGERLHELASGEAIEVLIERGRTAPTRPAPIRSPQTSSSRTGPPTASST